MMRPMLAGLRPRLSLLIFIALLPGLGLTLYTHGVERRILATQAKENSLRLARLASGDQQQLVEETRTLLSLLAQLPEVRGGDRATCGALFASLLRQFRQVANLGFITPDGQLACSGLPFTPPVYAGDRAYFRRAIARRGFAPGEFQIGRVTQRASINFGYPVLRHDERTLAGVVFAALDLGWISTLAARLDLPPGATVTVMDGNGIVLGRAPGGAQWTGRDIAESEISRVVRDQREGVAQARGVDGVERLYGFTRLLPSVAGSPFITVGVPAADAFAEMNRILVGNLVGLAAVTATVLLLVWFGGGSLIVKPVGTLVQATRALRAGNLAARAGLSRDEGELGQLGRAFDEMAIAISEREAHLQAAQRIAEEQRERAERQLRHTQALRTIDTAITSSLDLRVTLDVLLDQVTTQLQAEAAAVLLLNPLSRVLEHAASRGFRSAAIAQRRLPLGEGTAGRAAVERRSVHVARIEHADPPFDRPALLAEERFVSYHVAPLLAKGQILGVLEVFHRMEHQPRQDWLDFFEALAGQAAIAIDNASLLEDLQRANAGLVVAYESTLEGWSRAMDLRDKETEGHTQRVTELTMRLARTIGMPEEELVHVRRGALLHDIGKMGIPDSILLKPGPLTPEEWAIMKKHPIYARELLSPIPYLRPALPIPSSHHEQWDGGGYPAGLRGEEIPKEARIFAVVDVWDALISDRPYRPAWPHPQALAHIREQAGKYFDPRVVEAFLDLGL